MPLNANLYPSARTATYPNCPQTALFPFYQKKSLLITLLAITALTIGYYILKNFRSETFKPEINPKPQVDNEPELNAQYEITENTYWKQYKIKSKSGTSHYSDDLKFHLHVSMDRETITKVQGIIHPILARARIKIYKMLKPESIEYITINDNPYGKAFCIYLQYTSNERDYNSILKLTKDIDNALKTNNIKLSDQTSKGDITIPGHTYCSVRKPQTVFRGYPSADGLEAAGFTKKESACLSFCETFPCLNPEEVRQNLISNIDDATNENPYMQDEFSEKIFDQLYKDCFEPFNGLKNFPGLIWMLGDMEKDQYLKEYIQKPLQLIAPKIYLKSFQQKPRFSWFQIETEDPFERSVFKEEAFLNILKDASLSLAKCFKDRNIKPGAGPGIILPAIYYTIFYPLHETLSNETLDEKSRKPINLYKTDKDQKNAFFAFLTDHRQEIINAIVKTGLRDRNQSQIWSSTPILLSQGDSD